MTARFCLGALVTALFVGGVADAADWARIKPGVTTEAELVAAFGAPTEVVATFPWAEWSARWKKRPVTPQYVLRYRVGDSNSALLVGPGGKADDVEVDVWDRKVGGVRWHYGGPSARTAASLLRADPQMKFGAPEAMSHAGRSVEGGILWAEVGPNDSTVEVLLALK
jgi:hypothetical protein